MFQNIEGIIIIILEGMNHEQNKRWEKYTEHIQYFTQVLPRSISDK